MRTVSKDHERRIIQLLVAAVLLAACSRQSALPGAPVDAAPGAGHSPQGMLEEGPDARPTTPRRLVLATTSNSAARNS